MRHAGGYIRNKENPMKLVVAATPSAAHVAPMAMIAEDLAARGHDVTLVSGTAVLPSSNAVRTAAFDADADFDLDEVTRAERARPDAPPPGPELLNRDLQWGFIDPVPDQHRTLQRLLTDAGGEPVTILMENGFNGAWPMLLGAPGPRADRVIGIGISPLTLLSADTAPFGLGLPPDASTEGRTRNAKLNDQVRLMLAPAQERLDQVLDSLGANPAPFLFDGGVTLPDIFLALTIPSVEYPRSDAPASVRYIGPLPLATHDEGPLPQWWAEIDQARADDRQIVGVTQGTVNNGDLEMLVSPTLRALADRPDIFVVAATGRPDHGLTDPPNGRVGGYLPFSALLPRLDVLVTNGGYGGSLAALRHAVPLVLAGDTEDKIETTARLAWSGAGINLATGRPDEAALRSAIDTILQDPDYRSRARQISTESAGYDPLQSIADSLDHS
ncbi:nucleotide disphospho-sugar-binding domain-containing protein [uncultured Jatrophihabitans sp.]|uniref:nucleotide disphospho-sugar-binding domain-containing protein n=1 Tax=uncultured Jatrophihabitans sp. TaxID=1610747 RepID=UPI0035CC8F02